jgi:hypothetical protein
VTILKKLLYAASGVLGIPPIFITSAIAVILTIIIIEIVMILAGRSY